MACPEWSERLSAWIDGMLSNREQKDLIAHLNSCEDCRTTLNQLLNLRERLKSLPLPPPRPRMWARAVRHIRLHARSKRIASFNWKALLGFSLVGASAILLAFLLRFGKMSPNSQRHVIFNTLVGYHMDNASLALNDNPMCHLTATVELLEAEGNE